MSERVRERVCVCVCVSERACECVSAHYARAQVIVWNVTPRPKAISGDEPTNHFPCCCLGSPTPGLVSPAGRGASEDIRRHAAREDRSAARPAHTNTVSSHPPPDPRVHASCGSNSYIPLFPTIADLASAICHGSL